MKSLRLKLALLLFLLVGLQSCLKQQSAESDVKTIDISTDKLSWTSYKCDSIFDFNGYVLLESTDESLIREISKLYLTDNNIFVLDANRRILVFDTQGKYLKTIDHFGEGPNEYQKIQDFTVSDDTLYLLDNQSSRILKYSVDDTYISQENSLKAQGFFPFSTDTIAYNIGFGFADGAGTKNYSFALQRDKDVQYDLEFNSKMLGYVYSHSGALPFYKPSKGNVLMTIPFNHTIYFLNKSAHTPSPLIRFNFEGDKSEITLSDAEITDILSSAAFKNFFSIYLWEDDLFVGYECRECPFVYAIVNLREGKLKFNQPLGTDGNGLPVMPYSYISDSDSKQLLISVLQPIVIRSILKSKGDSASPLLKEIGMTTDEDSNPVLIFYDYKGADK